MIILDASVILRWFIEEEQSDKARKIQDDYLVDKLDIAVPDLLLYEVANALRFNKSFEVDEIDQVLTSLSDLGIKVLPINYALVGEAARLAYNYELTVYDAIYVELSLKLGAEFVTADQKLFEKVKDLPRITLLSDK
ncbi:hypothetical protein COT42_07425 [Candidatus Saganbacteria bacterium CG08_land_8_20_14_0_20_45_16]|uniref:PIN domain-containing protein n=1 Tax=Candidatus Saganbacteria bacterium CG08_land_8_20_14_0_20_45_16 TaxID=2014293 RepID=A0A2H0XV46_UNCSA|nr:MAG: hypothetical protein COT42_07425 [Candidatus Saganbacteria bacterium CG08_land_8_20_14_0_20_45_16]